MTTTKTIFILNPISGVSQKKDLPALIKQHYKNAFEIAWTEYAGHATLIAKEKIEQGAENIIAVGGDGTINEVAQSLVNTSTNLGIIPAGSGNGLARHLNLPLNTTKAIQFLNTTLPNKIDTGELNTHLFLCTSGLGLDAEVTHDFAARSTRGLKTYIQSGLSLFKSIENKNFHFSIDNKPEIEAKGIVFTIANASQYGNNAVISPLSLINDGILELCILPKMGLLSAISYLIKTFRGTLHNSSKANYFPFQTLKIKNETAIKAHVDGEPIIISGEITYKINPQSLSILY